MNAAQILEGQGYELKPYREGWYVRLREGLPCPACKANLGQTKLHSDSNTQVMVFASLRDDAMAVKCFGGGDSITTKELRALFGIVETWRPVQQDYTMERLCRDRGIPTKGIDSAPCHIGQWITQKGEETPHMQAVYYQYNSGSFHLRTVQAHRNRHTGALRKMDKWIGDRKDHTLWCWKSPHFPDPDPGTLYITEGESDCIALGQRGFNACATPGAGNLTEDRVSWMFGTFIEIERIRICFDADAAGDKGTSAAVAKLANKSLAIEVLRWPEGSDKGSDLCDLSLSKTAEFTDIILHSEWINPFRELALQPVENKSDRKPIDISEEELRLTQLGSASKIVELWGDDIKYVAEHNIWYLWTGVVWQADKLQRVHGYMHKLIEVYKGIAKDRNDEPLAKYVKSMEAASYHEAVLRTLARQEGITIAAKDMDVSMDILVFNNLTYDLAKGESREHRREDMQSRHFDYDYNPDGSQEKWNAFLEDFTDGDEAMEAFLCRCAGYSLTQSIRHQVLFMLLGDGSTGKSTFVETLLSVLGDKGEVLNCDAILDHGTAITIPNDLAGLGTASFISMPEIPQGKKINEEALKRITGGDTLSVRFMRGEFFKMIIHGKIWMTLNQFMKVRGQDEGIWRRLMVIPCNHVFENTPESFRTDLLAEREGIMHWMIAGYDDWRQRGGLGPPDMVIERGKSERHDADWFLRFCEDCLEDIDDRSVFATTKMIHIAYDQWCQDEGIRFPIPQQSLTKLIKNKKDWAYTKTENHKGYGRFYGVLVHNPTSFVHETADFSSPKSGD